MWRNVRCLVRPLVPAPLRRLWRSSPPPPPPPSETDAQLFGWLNAAAGELLPGFPITAADTVVDVGCGCGGSSLFAVNRGAEVIAVDIDPRALETVTRRVQGVPCRGFRAVLSDADPLPLPDAVATRVLAQEVMEHVVDPRRFLAELVRIGKPGALYLITVPDPVAEHVQKAVAPAWQWQRPHHLHIFERDRLDQLVREAGLMIERRTCYSFYWSMWWILRWSLPPEGNPFRLFGGAGAAALE